MSGRAGARWSAEAIRVNDLHSRLNPTDVAGVVEVASLEELRATLADAEQARAAVSIAGARHAMGGQQFGTDARLLDLRGLSRVVRFDRDRGTIEVEAGIRWPQLMTALEELQRGEPRPWGIRQKQTGADRLSLGGALAANIHGRGLGLAPFAADVESFTLVLADGTRLRCSREQHRDLFHVAIGGYGLFGVVHTLTLRLARRVTLERRVELRQADDLAKAVERRIAEGFTYGDFQFETESRSPGFLTHGVFACYRPLSAGERPPEKQRQLEAADWDELLYLAHVDKRRAFQRYSEHYLATDGARYASDTQQLGYYPDDYHPALDLRLGACTAGSEMISELYVPRERLTDFLHAAAADLRAREADVVYGTVRWIERDTDTLLAWAREPWACVVVNLHVDHDARGVAHARAAFESLIELARARGGSFYLTYHRWASRAAVEACHPAMVEFLRAKDAHDPQSRFQSDWWRHMRAMFADRLP